MTKYLIITYEYDRDIDAESCDESYTGNIDIKINLDERIQYFDNAKNDIRSVWLDESISIKDKEKEIKTYAGYFTQKNYCGLVLVKEVEEQIKETTKPKYKVVQPILAEYEDDFDEMFSVGEEIIWDDLLESEALEYENANIDLNNWEDYLEPVLPTAPAEEVIKIILPHIEIYRDIFEKQHVKELDKESTNGFYGEFGVISFTRKTQLTKEQYEYLKQLKEEIGNHD